MTTPALEERMARMEGSMEQIAIRLGTLEQDLRAGFQDMRAEQRRMFYALLLAIGTTVLATVLARLL
jgi:hypothetical protein